MFRNRWGLAVRYLLVALIVGGAMAPARRADAVNMSVQFVNSAGTVNILDNGSGDNNSTAGIINFSFILGPYQMAGDIDTGFSAAMTAITGAGGNYLRLTNFTAEALTPPPDPMYIQMYDQVIGSFGSLVGGDLLDAYADNAFAAAVPAGTNNILDWQGFVDLETIGNLQPGSFPFGNPLVPASAGPLPYTTITHGPWTMGASSYTNPVIGAYFTFQLGATGDQLKLQTSGEVGFAPVPEPATLLLASFGAVGLIGAALRRRARR